MMTDKIRHILKHYFAIPISQETKQETLDGIVAATTFRGANLWVLIFAIFTASLGLNVNSTAVIIGAMLISPLMGPIIGMGTAVGINDFELLKRSAKNYFVATVISVATATLYFLVTPLNEAQSELLARTSPTLYDVFIALCGGAAGITALCTKEKGNVIPGVAIATALMPPLCTAGYGLAMGNMHYFLGAFYLFFINTVFIALSTYAGIRLMRFESKKQLDKQRALTVRRYIIAIVLLTMIPAAFMTANIVHQSLFQNNVRRYIKSELIFPGTQVISSDVDREAKILQIVAVGKEILPQQQADAQSRLAEYGLESYQLSVIQGMQTDSILLLNSQLSSMETTSQSNMQRILEQSQQIHQLEQELGHYQRLETLGQTLRPEIQVLFPLVQSLCLSQVQETNVNDSLPQAYILALVTTEAGHNLQPAETTKLHEWLLTRTEADSLRLIVQPAGRH